MKKDIVKRYDIDKLVHSFYAKLKGDPVLGAYFNNPEILSEDFFSTISAFWENVLFFTGKYEGNPMMVHKALHSRKPLDEYHFSKWLEIFYDSVDEMYAGSNAELIKKKANNIATIMQIKIIPQPAIS